MLFVFFRRRLRQLAILLALVPGMAGAACLTDSDALRAVLALPGSQKSGQRYCLAPGRFDGLTLQDFADAFVGLDPTRPVVFEAEDPDNPPRLNMWAFFISPDRRGPRVESGDVILRGLMLDLRDEPVVPPGEIGFRGYRDGVSLGLGGVTRNVRLEGIRVVGPLGEARLGARETARILNGVHVRRSRDITILDGRFEGVLNGITVGGENILVQGNRMRRSWGDLVRIIPQVGLEGQCADTDGITLRNNILYDDWSNHRMHPDVVHLFPDSHVTCSIRNVLIEGTLAFPGATGLLQPAHPTGMVNLLPVQAPASLPGTPRQLHRLYGPGQTRLPPASCAEERIDIAVQLEGDSPGPVTLLPAAGTRLDHYGKAVPQLVLSSPWEVWRLMCRPDRNGTWTLIRQLPVIQGIFSNALRGKGAYSNITLRHNILWIPAGQAISFRDPRNRNIEITRNSLLRPWPGDANGDGRANTHADGFLEHHPAAQILVADIPGLKVRGNVATPPLKHPDARFNDLGMRHNDGGRALRQRFTTGPGPRLMPTTPAEAVALARPRAGGVLDGAPVGAVATQPGDDPYDWSWVNNPW